MSTMNIWIDVTVGAKIEYSALHQLQKPYFCVEDCNCSMSLFNNLIFTHLFCVLSVLIVLSVGWYVDINSVSQGSKNMNQVSEILMSCLFTVFIEDTKYCRQV